MKHPYIHPAAAALLKAHDQTNWAVTEDGLICGPTIFCRILKYKSGTPDYEIAWAFSSEALDLIPHPEDPSKKILKSAQYVTEPIDNTIPVIGKVELALRALEGALLAFQIGFGNLWHTDRTAKDKPEFFSNRFISYMISRDFDSEGKPVKFHVKMRVNPYDQDNNLGLGQDAHHSIMQKVVGSGVDLQTVNSRDEALQFIHQDFRKRRKCLIEGLQIQSWSDPHMMQNVAMWCYNQVAHLASEPKIVESMLFKGFEFALTRPAPSELMLEFGERSSDQSAEEEHSGSTLQEIADIDENHQPLAPFYKMREDVRTNWVAVENPGPPLLLFPIPICHDLKAYREVHQIDIFNGPDPIMVTLFERADHQIILARTSDGIEVHYTDPDTRYITYAPSCKDEALGLPRSYEPFFSDSGVAVVTRRPTSEAIPEGAKVFDQLLSDPTHRLICTFVPLADLVAHIEDKKFADALMRHKNPTFHDVEAPEQLLESATGIRDAFKKYSKMLLNYAKRLLPGNGDPSNAIWYSLGTGAACCLIKMTHMGQIWETALPMGYALTAAYLTEHLAINAQNPAFKKSMKTIEKTFIAAGILVTCGKFGQDVLSNYRTRGLEAFQDKEIITNVAAAGVALYHGLRLGKEAIGSISYNFKVSQSDPKLSSPTDFRPYLPKNFVL